MLKNLSSIDRAGADFQSSKMSKKGKASVFWCKLIKNGVQADDFWQEKTLLFFCQCHICWAFCFSKFKLYFESVKKNQSTPMIFGPSQALRWSRSAWSVVESAQPSAPRWNPPAPWRPLWFLRIRKGSKFSSSFAAVDRKIPLIPGDHYHRSTNITG